MKKYISLLILFILVLAGCSTRNGKGRKNSEISIPTYSRSMEEVQLVDGFNPYIIDFSSNGIFYFTQNQTESAESDSYKDTNDFYFLSHEEIIDNIPVCSVDGIIKDTITVCKDNGLLFDILSISNGAYITEYSIKGELIREIKLPDEFNNLTIFPLIAPYSLDGFIISVDDIINIIDMDGALVRSFEAQGHVENLITFNNGRMFAFINNNGKKLAEITEKGIDEFLSLPDDIEDIYALDDNSLVGFSSENIYLIDLNGETDIIVDLDRQEILSSQIRYIYENGENLSIVLADIDDSSTMMILSLVKISEESMGFGDADEIPDNDRTSDGRKIIHIAVPSDYRWQIEFHAKIYNQKSDLYYAETERFEGTIEDYLGKGNRPDVVMMEDITELCPLTEKGLLEDIAPLFSDQDKYKKTDILPKVIELLGDGEHMYAMSGRFTLLLRASDGTEFDDQGHCTTVDYLNWYDRFLDEKGIDGGGSLHELLYADIDSFYDSEAATADFESDKFKTLMETYKKVISKHEGSIDRTISDKYGWGARRIVEGPLRYPSWTALELTDPLMLVSGLPMENGESSVIMDVHYPLGVMSTSDCVDGAFDFIMYYSSLEEYLISGSSEASYGKAATTPAIFSTNIGILESEIYNTELPFTFLRSDSGEVKEYHYTQEQKDLLMKLIDSASGDTKIRRDLFKMLEEEMDGFLKDSKPLDDCCRSLQSRAIIYLGE